MFVFIFLYEAFAKPLTDARCQSVKSCCLFLIIASIAIMFRCHFWPRNLYNIFYQCYIKYCQI